MFRHKLPALTRNAALTAILAVAPAVALTSAHAADQDLIQKVNGTPGMTQGQLQGTQQGQAQGTGQGTDQGTAQSTEQGTTQGEGQDQSPSTAQGTTSGTGQTQSTAAMQSGSEFVLTEEQVAEWEGRPVVNAEGDEIGQVTQVVLNDQGNISELHFETGQALGIGTKSVKVDASEFSADDQQVKLDMSNEEIQDLPEAQTSQ